MDKKPTLLFTYNNIICVQQNDNLILFLKKIFLQEFKKYIFNNIKRQACWKIFSSYKFV